jgi:hypothetical protein
MVVEALNLKTILKLLMAFLLAVAGYFALPEEDLPTGVVAERLSQEPRYTIDGQEVSRKDAERALIENEVPDDSGKIRLVLIGTDTERAKVLEDFQKPRLKALSEKLVINAYPSDHPLVRDRGYQTGGSPSIYVMQSDGKVLGRNKDGKYYGAEWLACAIEQKPYDPSQDPDLTPQPAPGPQPVPNPLPNLQQVPWYYWALGLFVVWYVFLRKGKNP